MFSLLGFVFCLITLALWFLAIIDCGRHIREHTLYALIWIFIILSFPIAGSLLYFMFKDRSFPDDRNIDPEFGEMV